MTGSGPEARPMFATDDAHRKIMDMDGDPARPETVAPARCGAPATWVKAMSSPGAKS